MNHQSVSARTESCINSGPDRWAEAAKGAANEDYVRDRR
jgi:hypothetical protein